MLEATARSSVASATLYNLILSSSTIFSHVSGMQNTVEEKYHVIVGILAYESGTFLTRSAYIHSYT